MANLEDGLTKLTVAEIKTWLGQANFDLTAAQKTALATDSRRGVRQAYQQFQRQKSKQHKQQTALWEHLQLERQLWPQYPLIAGIDEVGRGPLAGPVITAAVILPHDFQVLGIDDSKKLSAAQRQRCYLEILKHAQAVGIGIGSPALIDRENIYHATELTMAQAVKQLALKPDYLLVDAMHVPYPLPQQKIIHGDQKSASIAAASIVAKQVRDHLMATYARVYPGYDFQHNVGYGTKRHLQALQQLGVTPIHRRSFKPVTDALLSS